MKLQNKYIVKLGPPDFMWCVHTRWGPTIKRWGNLSCIQSDVMCAHMLRDAYN